MNFLPSDYNKDRNADMNMNKNEIKEEAYDLQSKEEKTSSLVNPFLRVDANHLKKQESSYSPLISPLSRAAGNERKEDIIAPSTSSLAKEEDIKQKCGQIWRCVDRITDAETGEYSYLFEVADDYNFLFTDDAEENYQKKYSEFFPAPEADNFELLYLDPNYSPEKYIQLINKRRAEKNQTGPCALFESIKSKNSKALQGAQLNKLGFEAGVNEEGVFQLKLPSRENLLVRWAMLQKENKNLPDISIYESEGIAEDQEFIDAFLDNKLILSSGKEFIHDLLGHFIPILSQLLDKPEKYLKLKNTFQAQIKEILKEIEIIEKLIKQGKPLSDLVKRDLPKLKAALAASIDIWTASLYPSDIGSIPIINRIVWNESIWKTYWEKRYPEEDIDFSSLSSLLGDCSTIVKEYQEME